MQLKYLIIFLAIGTTMAELESHACAKRKIQSCFVEMLENSLNITTDKEEMCSFLYQASQCARDGVEECLGDNRDRDIDEALNEMDAQIEENCLETESTTTTEQDSNVCLGTTIEVCIDKLLEKAMDDTIDEDEMCPVLYETSQCIRDSVQECLGDITDQNLDEMLDEMDAKIRENCLEKEDESEQFLKEGQQCVEDNEEYILNCISESALELSDDDAIKCTMYSLVADCVTTRATEKCGQEVGEYFKKEMDDMPEEIKEDCSTDNSIDLFSVVLQEDKRRKK